MGRKGKTMKTKQLSTFVDNRPGRLAELCRILRENGIDLRALSVVDAMEFGIVRLIVGDPDGAAKILEDRGYLCQVAEVVIVAMQDRPGAFGEILDVLTNAGVNIDATYTCLPKEKDRAYLVLKVKDTEGAEACLRTAGVEIVTSEKLAELFGE